QTFNTDDDDKLVTSRNFFFYKIVVISFHIFEFLSFSILKTHRLLVGYFCLDFYKTCKNTWYIFKRKKNLNSITHYYHCHIVFGPFCFSLFISPSRRKHSKLTKRKI
ncbi:hypothetical protein SSS_10097, partial [Sarcoptes scabiei]